MTNSFVINQPPTTNSFWITNNSGVDIQVSIPSALVDTDLMTNRHYTITNSFYGNMASATNAPDSVTHHTFSIWMSGVIGALAFQTIVMGFLVSRIRR